MSARFGRIALLQGGSSPEREVSFMSAQMVGAALDEMCAEVIRFDPAERSIAELVALKPDAVFNILHGGAGENGVIQATLEMLAIPFTGSRHLGCALAMDKNVSKTIWAKNLLPTPAWLPVTEVSDAVLDQILLELGEDLFVKPNSGGSSLNSRRVRDREQLAAILEEVLAVDAIAMVEQNVEGIELTYGILGDQVLPGIRIEVVQDFYDYKAKYEVETTRFICPPRLPRDLDKIAARLSRQAFDILGCSSWGRVDLIANGNDMQLLEVNTIPGMTSHSLVPKAAAAVQIDFAEVVARILADAR